VRVRATADVPGSPASRTAPVTASGTADTGSSGDGRAHPPHSVGRAAALLPPCFFAASVAFFSLAALAAPFLVPQLRASFYAPRILAFVHALTLGWISTAMVGVLYRYVPALTKRALPHSGLACIQATTFVPGVAALVAFFWCGRWDGVAAAAAVLTLSSALLCVNLWPLLLGAPRRGVAEVGVLCSSVFLVAAAALGTILAAGKLHPLLGGSPLANLGAHVHLAAVGWVGLTICALSFRFLPAFLLPVVQFPEASRRQVAASAAALVLLAASLLAQSTLALPAALGVAATLVLYVGLLGKTLAGHRLPLDWTARHAFVGTLWLLASTAAGSVLAASGLGTEPSVRLAAAYGVGGVLGWMSNLLIGVSYKLFPGFVGAARSACGRRAVPIAELGVSAGVQTVVFVVYNLGVLAIALALLVDVPPALFWGSVLLALGALLYAGAMARTLSFTLVDPIPPATSLRVLDPGG